MKKKLTAEGYIQHHTIYITQLCNTSLENAKYYSILLMNVYMMKLLMWIV